MLFATAHHDGGLLFRPLRRASYHRAQQRGDSAACCPGRAPAAKPAAAAGGAGPAATGEPASLSSQQLSLPRRGVVLLGALAGVLGARPAQVRPGAGASQHAPAGRNLQARRPAAVRAV